MKMQSTCLMASVASLSRTFGVRIVRRPHHNHQCQLRAPSRPVTRHWPTGVSAPVARSVGPVGRRSTLPRSQMTGGLAADGNIVVSLFPGTSLQSSTTQILASNLEASTIYTLTVSVGDRLSLPFAGYSVSLLAGGTAVATITSSDLGALLPPDGGYTVLMLTYVRRADRHAKSSLGHHAGRDGDESNEQPARSSTMSPLTRRPVPEPTAIGGLLVASGSAMLAPSPVDARNRIHERHGRPTSLAASCCHYRLSISASFEQHHRTSPFA